MSLLPLPLHKGSEKWLSIGAVFQWEQHPHWSCGCGPAHTLPWLSLLFLITSLHMQAASLPFRQDVIYIAYIPSSPLPPLIVESMSACSILDCEFSFNGKHCQGLFLCHLCILSSLQKVYQWQVLKKHWCIIWSLPLTTLTYPTLKFIPKLLFWEFQYWHKCTRFYFWVQCCLWAYIPFTKLIHLYVQNVYIIVCKLYLNKHNLLIIFLF